MDGNVYDYGFRIYNPQIAKFLSVDPLTESYPFYTPYQFAGNMPIVAIDLDGAEPEFMIDKNGKLKKPMIALYSAAFLYKAERISNIKLIHMKRTKYMAQTQFAIMPYNPACMNYCENSDPEEFLNIWFNVTVHEFGHRNNYRNRIEYYLWTGLYGIQNVTFDLFDGDGNYNGYSKKAPEEVECYSKEGLVVQLINMDNGAALKTLQSDFSEAQKVAVLTYLGTKFRASQAAVSLESYRKKAESNGKVSNKEKNKIRKLTKKADALEAETKNLKSNDVTELLKKLDKMPKKQINSKGHKNGYDTDAYDANNDKIKEQTKTKKND